MLSKPGEARKSSTPSQRRRKVVEENLDDVVRRLQRLPPNKVCADCSSKLTQCVNLTHGTFVCMACSGVHREFNHKIKGIGHSSFTADEVSKLRHPSSGNEAVNAHYLAKYGRNERMKQPTNNNDLQHLRSWIQAKYIDKLWCDKKASSSSTSGGGGGSRSSTTKPPKSKSETSRRKIMPKVNEPAASSAPTPPAPAPVADPFGFDSIAPSQPSSSANNDAGWDAFGDSTQTQNNVAPPAPAAFQADFGGMSSAPVSAPPPPAAPPAAPPAFQADFGGFSQQQTQQQQPTMVSLPPAAPSQHQQQQPAQPSFQVNFDQAPAAQVQPQQQQQNQNQMDGFANFSSVPPPQPQQMPQMQQQNIQNDQQGGGFANFSSMQQGQPQQQMQQMQQTPQPQMGQGPSGMPMQGAGEGMGNQNNNLQQGNNMNFGQFPQQPSQPQMQMQQPQQQSQIDQSGFANFSSISPPQQQQQQQNAPNQQNQMKMGQPQNTMQMQAQQQPGMTQPTLQPTQAPQPSPQMAPMQGGAVATLDQRSSAISDISEHTGGASKAEAAAAVSTTAPTTEPPKEEDKAATMKTNPKAFSSMDNNRASAFDDAFGGLSLEPTPATYMGGSAASSEAPAPAKKKDLNFTKFQEGQQVLYSNSEGSCLATITKVHYDDELHPYYTINMNGMEKQTDDAHLSVPNESSMMQGGGGSLSANSGNGAPPGMLEETSSMLHKLNAQQLMQVHQFVASMVMPGNNHQSGATAPSSGQNLQMNGAHQQQQQTQQHQMSFGSFGSAANSTPSMGNGLPDAPMGGAATALAAGQFSMQQHQQPQQHMNQGMMHTAPMGMGMNAPAGVPTSSTMPTPAQATMQQNSNHSIPQQQQQPTMGMGMGTMNTQQNLSSGGAMAGMGAPPVSAPTPPSTMPPPPPAGAAMGQLSMQQSQSLQQGAMGMMGNMNGMPASAPPPPPPAAAESPALPPVEKEGNPFDFY